MSGYRKMDNTAYCEDFPDIDARKLEKEINKLFKPYLFYHDEKSKRRFECSYCGETFSRGWVQRTMTQNDQWLIDCGHNDEATCPCCGTAATVKNISRLGKKKKLEQYIPVCIISEKNNELYVRAYWARKNYQQELTAMPEFYLPELYHFAPNKAEMFTSYYGKISLHASVSDNYDPNHRKITEPFAEGNYYFRYLSYYVFGWEELEKSDFYRYCQYDSFRGRSHEAQHYDLIKYLAAYSIYPRNIEMLIKSGMRRYVDELVKGRRKNAKAIKWGEGDPRKAFGLDGQELKAFLAERCDDPRLPIIYKKFRRAGIKADFSVCKEMIDTLNPHLNEYVDICIRLGIKPARLMSYLEKNRYSGCMATVAGIYIDYIRMAEMLGWDLTDETMKFPKNLDAKHDEATQEVTAMGLTLTAASKQTVEKMAKGSLARRALKYNFSLDGYFIRVAETGEEILAEGKTLHHCVGGYVQRHMTDKTTILFLRSERSPDVPLVTIEMNGIKLVQIHGYRNDANAKMPPRVEYGFIVEPWLKWIKDGSKRDKEGNPKIRKKKEIAAA